jgi:hypothetical protein
MRSPKSEFQHRGYTEHQPGEIEDYFENAQGTNSFGYE